MKFNVLANNGYWTIARVLLPFFNSLDQGDKCRNICGNWRFRPRKMLEHFNYQRFVFLLRKTTFSSNKIIGRSEATIRKEYFCKKEQKQGYQKNKEMLLKHTLVNFSFLSVISPVSFSCWNWSSLPVSPFDASDTSSTLNVLYFSHPSSGQNRGKSCIKRKLSSG